MDTKWVKQDRTAIASKLTVLLEKTRDALLAQVEADQKKIREMQEKAQKGT
jgi:hypothetical protein